jgi:TIR domain
MAEQDFTIFVSHASLDQEIAAAIMKFITDASPEQRVFVSSDPETLMPGDEWVEKVLSALQSAKVVLAICTERGLGRKWVWFEAGRTWFAYVPLIPCCIGNMRKANLPAPFANRQSLNIDEPRDVAALFRLLQKQFGEFARLPAYEDFAQTMTRLDVRAEERSKVEADPHAAEIAAAIERTLKSLTPAEVETIRQFVLYGELSTTAAKTLVKVTGVDMERWSVPEALVGKTGWLIPKSGNKPYDEMPQNVYTLNPTVRLHLQAYFPKR